MNRRDFIKSIGVGAIAIASGTQIVGCATIPTVEDMTITSELIGRSTGMVIKLTKIEEEQKTTLIEVLDHISGVIPVVGGKFADCWEIEAEKYLADKSMDDKKKSIIIAAVKIAGKGMDYLFNVRYPKAMQYTELIESAVHGFVDGIKSTIYASTTLSATSVYDKDAFIYLTTH